MKSQPSEARPACRDEASAPSDRRPVRKQRPRLGQEAYIGPRTYHVTLTTTRRAPFMERYEDASRVRDALEDVAGKMGFRLLAYCLMPDHLHVLLRGTSLNCDLLRFVQRFKQVTSYRFKQDSGVPLWQQSFYDRFLRQADNVASLARYILANPAEAGLPEDSPAWLLMGGEYYVRGVADGAKASSLHGLSCVEGFR